MLDLGVSMLAQRLTFWTPLARDEAVRRLQANVDSNWRFFGDKRVVGFVGEGSFALRVRISYRNSFQTNLRGRMINEAGGTRIRCSAGVHPAVMAFMAVWFSFVALFTTVSVGAAIDGQGTLFNLIPFGMLFFGIALVAAGRRFAHDELPALIAFLEETIEATPVK